MVNKILFITLSNIGDVVLTLPALDYLRANFPQAEITVMAGPRAAGIFKGNPAIAKLTVYDKHISLREKVKLLRNLRNEKFDCVIDLRNSLFGVLIPAKYKTSPFLFVPKRLRHMKERHLYKVKQSVSVVTADKPAVEVGDFLFSSPGDQAYINNLLAGNDIRSGNDIAVISPGARSHIKRWAKEKFVRLIDSLIAEFNMKVILAGDKDDSPAAQYIAENCKYPVLNLSGRTDLAQLIALLKKANLVITNDSSVLHLSSYLNRNIIAIFGSTDDSRYGPWAENWAIVKKEVFCRPCQEAQCKYGRLDCMRFIRQEDVLGAIKKVLSPKPETRITGHADDFNRILIARTDRIGDVILSTPVIKALRDAYPNAYIAMMAAPQAREIVEGNPYLDDVIIYDKDKKHKSWYRFFKFAQNLKKKRFDLAVILHPANRVHLLTFLAGIRRRVGYDRKLGFLLTDRIKHTKQSGAKHEVEYNLDLLKSLGIQAKDKSLFMPIKEEAQKWVEDLFRQEGISPADKLLVIHPGASCPSKIWPAERFAEAADKLAKKYGFKILLVAGPKDIGVADKVIKAGHNPLINLSGRTSVAQLAALFKRCRLLISNDSGPVHIASAVGTPVISIFGRAQAGLNPRRWGPVGIMDRFLHKEVGCIECLAHDCVKEFACLKAIGVDDVLRAAEEILR